MTAALVTTTKTKKTASGHHSRAVKQLEGSASDTAAGR